MVFNKKQCLCVGPFNGKNHLLGVVAISAMQGANLTPPGPMLKVN